MIIPQTDAKGINFIRAFYNNIEIPKNLISLTFFPAAGCFVMINKLKFNFNVSTRSEAPLDTLSTLSYNDSCATHLRANSELFTHNIGNE